MLIVYSVKTSKSVKVNANEFRIVIDLARFRKEERASLVSAILSGRPNYY